jgi:uncharacterized protein (DUF488 family)
VSIFTIGHSTRSLDELVELLAEHGITVVADVRTAPGSRRLPQFARAALADELPKRGLRYVHLPQLGGFRRPRPGSPNDGWRNESFRGYADHMATAEWREGVERLIELGRRGRVAAMCAEAVPWRCHRSLIADGLVARGISVVHLLSPGHAQAHNLTPFARVEGERVTYPSADTLPLDG